MPSRMEIKPSHNEFRRGVIAPVDTFREAWQLVKSDYPLLFVVTIIGVLLGSIVPIILTGPFVCGIYLCFLDKYDGRELRLDRVFEGFRFWRQSILIMAAILIPVAIVVAAVYLPLFLAAISGVEMTEAELWRFIAVTIATEAVLAFVMVCFHTLLVFAIPLVVDRGMTGVSAIRLSARAVWANLSGIVGVMAIGMVVSIVGYLMLCFGIYFVMPLLVALSVVAYRKVFPIG